MAAEEKILETIRRLIAHAEGTPNEEEAANYWGKAQELMTKYAIDEAMARSSGGQTVSSSALGKRIEFSGQKQMRGKSMRLLNTVAHANRCQLVDCRTHMILVGMENDVAYCEMLWTSLLLEGTRWMSKDHREFYKECAEECPEDPKMASIWVSRGVYYQNWHEAFRNRIYTRLDERNRMAQQEREVAAGTETVALALRETKAIVQEKIEEMFPFLRKGRSGGRSRSYSSNARTAGDKAGSRADLGGRKIGGSRPALPGS